MHLVLHGTVNQQVGSKKLIQFTGLREVPFSQSIWHVVKLNMAPWI